MAGSVDHVLRSQGATSNGDVSPRRPDADRLELLYRELEEILGPGPPASGPRATLCPTAPLRDELAGVLQTAAQELAARLRGELPGWTAAREHFQRLSQCRYLALPGNLAALVDELDTAGRQAEQVAEALEALGTGRFLPPRVRAVERPRLARLPEPLPESPPLTDTPAASPLPSPAQLREVREVVKEQAAKRQEPPAAPSLPAKKVAAARESSVVRMGCPSCGTQGAIRWDKLGVVHVCRGCSRSFRVDPKGGLVEVVRTEENKWVDKTAQAARSWRRRAGRLVTRRLLPVLGLVGVVLLVFWLTSRPAQSTEVELPRELQPRAELFAEAWLKKDWARLRLLVRPGEDRTLYKWSVHHPPPAAGEKQVEVTVISNQAQKATVQVRVCGAGGNSGKGDLELMQYWEERGGTWYFVVPAR